LHRAADELLFALEKIQPRFFRIVSTMTARIAGSTGGKAGLPPPQPTSAKGATMSTSEHRDDRFLTRSPIGAQTYPSRGSISSGTARAARFAYASRMARCACKAVLWVGIASSACGSGRQEGDRAQTVNGGTGVLIWSLSNGRGGTNELCRASACLPWLTAAARGTLVIGDFDGDRALDVAREADGGIVVSLGGNGGFRDVANWRGAPGEQLAAQLLPLGDIDGDGRPDVLGLVVGMYPTGGEPMVLPPPRAPRLVLLRGTPDGLARPEPFASLDGWSSDPRIAAGDLDGDHRPDVALAGIRGNKPPVLVGIRGSREAAPSSLRNTHDRRPAHHGAWVMRTRLPRGRDYRSNTASQ
jgi:hypothetical protein